MSDILVIGAGLIGSSVAMHLARLGANSVTVLDFDLEGTFSSSELNAGGVRATWIQDVNFQTSKLSIEYYASIADEVGYKACGYLWLHTEEKLAKAVQAAKLQIDKGWPIDVWTPQELTSHIPLIDKTDGIAGALFSQRDGLINPNLLKNHFRHEARVRGVSFEDRVKVQSAEMSGGKVKVRGERLVRVIHPDTRREILSGRDPGSSTIPREKVEFDADIVINCAGAWSGEVAKILGYTSPCYPLRRQVCIFDSRDVDLKPYGMIVDTSGVYFHPEAENGLGGFATPQEKPGIVFDYDGEDFFNEYIWPQLYERSTGFERLKHITGWSGLYEISPDESAIIGLVENGEAGKSGRFFEANAFSGHGAMHSYGAGLALAERVVKGKYETLDCSILSGKRFETGKLVRETLVI